MAVAASNMTSRAISTPDISSSDRKDQALSRSLADKLRSAWRTSDSALCVGLDPRPERLPAACRKADKPLLAFCRGIVDATAHLVCAYKPQIACFAAERAESELVELLRHIRAEHPRVPVILDAKRGDIGATAELYAREAFAAYQADAVTVNPYLGWDALAPFTSWPGRGAFVLCHTSNPDSGWLQEHPPGDPIYLRVAALAAARDEGNLGLVVGATYPEQLAAVRARAPALPLLVPGVGVQGGDVAAVFARGLDGDGAGLVVNASRSVIFASDQVDWAQAAARAATALRDDMRRARDATLTRR